MQQNIELNMIDQLNDEEEIYVEKINDEII
jgi:hypothetical protein